MSDSFNSVEEMFGCNVFNDVVMRERLPKNTYKAFKQAIKGSGGAIEIEAHKIDGRIIIRVSDTGKGISSEDIGRVFDPFYTTKSPGEGTGLGLWMTYEIIKSYDGVIDVESELEKGTTFRIILNEDNNGDA